MFNKQRNNGEKAENSWQTRRYRKMNTRQKDSPLLMEKATHETPHYENTYRHKSPLTGWSQGYSHAQKQETCSAGESTTYFQSFCSSFSSDYLQHTLIPGNRMGGGVSKAHSQKQGKEVSGHAPVPSAASVLHAIIMPGGGRWSMENTAQGRNQCL